MANVMKNRLNTVLTQAQDDLITSCLKTIIQQLPESGNVTLDDSDRYSLTSLDVDNKAFVEDAIAELIARGQGIIPTFITAEMMQNDKTLFEQLDKLEGNINDVLQRVQDMKRIVASEAYGSANLIYGVFGTAANAGLPGAQAAYDKMKTRYKDNGKSGGGGAQAKVNP